MSRIYKYYDLSRIMHAKYMPVKIPFNLSSLIATWFFIGRIPIASGTLASIAFYPIYYYIVIKAQTLVEVTAYLWILCAMLFILGFWSVIRFQDVTKTFDHSYVVIDEIIGMNVTLAISFEWLYTIAKSYYALIDIKPHNLAFIMALLVFRFYDIRKPFFIKYVDRYYKNPFGVILDDILAAIFSAATFYIIYLVYDFFTYL